MVYYCCQPPVNHWHKLLRAQIDKNQILPQDTLVEREESKDYQRVEGDTRDNQEELAGQDEDIEDSGKEEITT